MAMGKKSRKLKHMYKERGKEADSSAKNQEREPEAESKKTADGNQSTRDGNNLGGNKNECPVLEEDRMETKENIIVHNSCDIDKFQDTDITIELPKIDHIKTEKGEEYVNCDVNTDLIKKTYRKKLSLKEVYRNESRPKRRILPELNEIGSRIFDMPQFKCCILEHNYFNKKEMPSGSLSESEGVNGNFSDSNVTTLPFENRIILRANRTEQQTTERNNSTTKHVGSSSRSKECNSYPVRRSLRKRSVTNKNLRSSEAIRADKSKLPPTDECKKVKSPVSDGRKNSADLTWQKKSPMTGSDVTRKKVSDKVPNLPNKENRIGKASEDSSFSNRLVTLDEIDREITEMEKLIQSKCEILCEKKKEDSESKATEILPPKLKKITTKDVVNPEPQKDGDYILPMPNLTKMVPEDKNWNLEYTEDDVKNLGLDDLLLRASELNAENFTKALGQNSVNRNGSKGDDIVLTFPNSRRNSEDGRESDASKAPNKKAKLDFMKRYVKDEKPGKAQEEEPPKKAPEVSPKRPGIKVKTVQNINEEFNDAIGAKMKSFDGRDILPDSSISPKPLFTVPEDLPKSNKEIFIPEVPPLLENTRNNAIQKPEAVKTVEGSEDTRPFIMTIIQNKESAGSEHRPAILRSPKVFPRSKPGNTETAPLEERRNDANSKKDESNARTQSENVTLLVTEPRASRPFEVVNVDELDPKKSSSSGNPHYVVRRKNIPFILNNSRKYLRMSSSGEKSAVDEGGKRVPCRPLNRLVKYPGETANIVASLQSDKSFPADKGGFAITSVEQKIPQKDSGGMFIKLVPGEAPKVPGKPEAREKEGKQSEERETDRVTCSKPDMISLGAFSSILKYILPEKWILSLDKRHGLQIIKTHLDELLNPSIMISVVVGRTGKVTVNVRGRQLEKNHDLFSNLCDVANSKEKISINYILAILNKLRFFNVCFGCDDLSLKKYWCEDGFIEYYTEFQQTYRSHICELLVRLGKKRCYPCYRMHESLKKRKRREQLLKNAENGKSTESVAKSVPGELESGGSQGRGVKRNLEEFLEESFSTMKQKIADEIEKTREDDENEKVPKTQDEVLSFMGLTRKDSLDVNLRKSKRERKGFKKCESMINNNVNKEELFFLEKYWPDINVLFSTSLLIGAYSRTSTGRLREKCRMFHKLLSTWRGIVKDNPEWIGGYLNLAENLVEDEDPLNEESAKEKFDKMDIPALRAYIINCVKEVNKIKSRLRTKNTYFKVLYNTFVKPRMKKARQSTESGESQESKDTTPTPKESPAEEDSPEKEIGKSANTTPTDLESSDEKDEDTQFSNGLVMSCNSDGE